MVKVQQMTDLAPGVLADAQAWYERQWGIPAPFKKLNPIMLRYAYEKAERDWHRVVLDDDGTLTVYNNPQW